MGSHIDTIAYRIIYIFSMDLNHDYKSKNDQVLVYMAADRLQRIKTAILSFGDMGYTDPPVPNIALYIGEYTDTAACRSLESAIRTIILDSCTAQAQEIVNISVQPNEAYNGFVVSLNMSFGTGTFEFGGINGI